MSSRRRGGRAVAASVLLLTTTLGLTGITAPATAEPDRATPGATPGQTALDQYGDRLDEVARLNGLSEAHLRRILRTDPTARLDAGGRLHYVEPVADGERGPVGEGVAPFPLDQTFLLHSRPSSTKKIYLDFDGETVSGTAWNAADQGLPNGFYAGYSLDGSATFNDTEKEEIQKIWQRVAEDYATFDVDVTTQDPGADAIDRTSQADQSYGTRALVSGSSAAVQTLCQSQCGGLAYLGVFDQFGTGAGSHSYYQPAWIFSSTLANSDTKSIAEATSHEVGHNFGLDHDGTASEGYYTGHAMWAPIMGVGYYRPVVQWSKGEYAGANNTEDDLAIIAGNGTPVLPDDAGDTVAAAAALASRGVIGTAGDVDVYALGSCTGAVTVTATGAAPSQNLDIKLDLLDASGAVVATANPAATYVSADNATGLDASISTNVASGTYYARVDGVGVGTASTGYTEYASTGSYSLARTGCSTVTTVPSVPQGLQAVRNGTSVTVTWTAPASDGGSSVTGYTVGRTGAPSEDQVALTKTWTGLTPGTTYTFTVAAKNAVGTGAPASTSVSVPSVPGAPTGLSVTPAAAGTSATVTWSPPASDGGSAVTGYTVTRSGAPAVQLGAVGTYTWTGLTPGQAYTFTVAATNAQGTGTASSADATMPAPVAAPGQPASFTATAASNGQSATLAWAAPASDGGSAVTGYQLTRTGAGPVDVGTVGSYAWSGLTPGASYTFTVRARNAVGLGPAATQTLTMPTVAPPPPPPPPAAAAPSAPVIGKVKSGARGGVPTAKVAWSAPASAGTSPLTGYKVVAMKVSRSGKVTRTLVSKLLPPSTLKVNAALPRGRFKFAVIAVNAVGESPRSAESRVVATR